MTALRFTSARRATRAAATSCAGGRRGEIYRALLCFATRYGDLIRARFPKIPRRVSGYNLDNCCRRTASTWRARWSAPKAPGHGAGGEAALIHSPPERSLVVLGFDYIFTAADAVPRVLEFGPIGGRRHRRFPRRGHAAQAPRREKLKILPEGAAGWWWIRRRDEEEAAEKAERLEAAPMAHTRPSCSRTSRTRRRSGRCAKPGCPPAPTCPAGRRPGRAGRTPPSRGTSSAATCATSAPCSTGMATEPDVRPFRRRAVHSRISFDLRHEKEVETWRRFLDEAADLVVRYGGSLSGEHGDGQAKAALLEKMYGPELIAGLPRVQGDLGSGWPDEPGQGGGSLSRSPPTCGWGPATSRRSSRPGLISRGRRLPRCGGTLRRRWYLPAPDTQDEVMCPSYLATREEKHSTRGRARMLFEMLHGGPLRKAGGAGPCTRRCTSAWPARDARATARYMSTWPPTRPSSTPTTTRAVAPPRGLRMGLIQDWAALAAHGAACGQCRDAGAGHRTRGEVAGRHRAAAHNCRPSPPNLHDLVRAARRPAEAARRVLLWPDTFNNYFRPETAKAAVRLLEASGCVVHSRPRAVLRPPAL